MSNQTQLTPFKKTNNTTMKTTHSLSLILCAAPLLTLTGCVGYVDTPGVRHAQIRATVSNEDDYVYYPRYSTYYGRNSHQYTYRQGNSWVSRPSYHGTSSSTFFSSPSVSVDFRDTPSRHHAEVSRTYPRSWNYSSKQQPLNHQREDRRQDEQEYNRR